MVAKNKCNEKPGQKYVTPHSSDSLYKFYTSLHQQNKKSPMAIKWCIEHGVFRRDKAARLNASLLADAVSKIKIK